MCVCVCMRERERERERERVTLLQYIGIFGFVLFPLFNGISTLIGDLMSQPVDGVGIGIHTYSKDIRPKVNIFARPEFELADSDISVQHVNPYPCGLTCWIIYIYIYIYID